MLSLENAIKQGSSESAALCSIQAANPSQTRTWTVWIRIRSAGQVAPFVMQNYAM